MSEPLDLEPIKARLSAATPGPWRQDDSDAPFYDIRMTPEAELALQEREGPNHCTEHDEYPEVATVNASRCYGSEFADSQFIAHAPTDIAALIAEVERLRAKVWECEAYHSGSGYL